MKSMRIRRDIYRSVMLMLAIVCSMIFNIQAFAEEAVNNGNGYVVTVFNDQTGLPTGEANAVAFTNDGYIWVGSYEGLLRYNGQKFRNYSAEGQISTSIRTLFVASDGTLWVGTNDTGVYHLVDNKFEHIESPERNEFLCVRDFAEGPDGSIYVASNSGVAIIRNGEWKIVKDSAVYGSVVYNVALDSFGRIWASLDNGLCVVLEDGRLAYKPSELGLLGSEEIYCLTGDKDGNIYLGSNKNTVLKLSMTGRKAGEFEKKSYKLSDMVTINRMRAVDKGDLLVCGEKGMVRITADDEKIVFGQTSKAEAIKDSCLDYEGNIWVASIDHGLLRYSDSYYTTPNVNAGLEDVTVNCVTHQGKYFYVGTVHGLRVFNEQWMPAQITIPEELWNDRIRCMVPDVDGTVWVGTAYGGLVHFEQVSPDEREVTGLIKVYDTSEGMPSNEIRSVIQMSDGSIAVGTQAGFAIIRNGVVSEVYNRRNGLGNTVVLSLLEDNDGRLLVGTDGGGIYKLNDGVLKLAEGDESLTERVILRMIKSDDRDGYFISAGSSLYFYDGVSYKKLSNFKKMNGSIFDLYEKNGALWLLQNGGITAVLEESALQDEEAQSWEYSYNCGLTGSMEANTWHFLDARTGSLYISTRNGISIFEFEALSGAVPIGIIDDVVVDGVIYEHPTSVELSKDAMRITIDFSKFAYTGASSSISSYVMVGFDKDFDDYSIANFDDVSDGSVSYTNLPGGDYVFHFYISEPGTLIPVHDYTVEFHKERKIVEYWWFTPAIVALAAILVGIVISIIAWFRVSEARKRAKEYKDIVDQALTTIANTIDAKDEYTNGHSLRVAKYSRMLAKRMGMSEAEQERIYYIAQLHDIGKIGVPDAVLNKRGGLTPEERRTIQEHTTKGGKILANFNAIEGIADGARYHHEKIDGSGYNAGLAGDQIPLVARIIGVADTYDAMQSTRVYRKGLTVAEITEELKKVSGTQLDASIVKHMLDMIEEGDAPVKME